MTQILIQPTLDEISAYDDFAIRLGLGFEIIDFSFPSSTPEGRQRTLDGYLHARETGAMSSPAVSMHGAFIDLYLNSPDCEARSLAERRFLENLSTASRLGLEYLVFHSNSLPMIGWATYYDRWVETHATFWRKALDTFSGTIVIENMWERDPSLLLRLMETVGSPRLKVCLDTGHVRVFSGCSMETWFRMLGKHIAYIHMNDNHGEFDDEIAIGDGVIDWNQFDALVREHCSNPVTVLEHASLEMISRSVDFLSTNGLYPFR